MKTLLGLFLALLLPLLAACGEGDSAPDASAPDSSATPSQTPSDDPSDGPSDAMPTCSGASSSCSYPPLDVVAILDESNAKDTAAGADEGQAVVLDSDQAIEEFAGRFSGRSLPDEIREAASNAKPGDGRVLVGAPVALGCTVPTEVAVIGHGDDLAVTAVGLTKKDSVQCLVPVLTVALVLVEEARVG